MKAKKIGIAVKGFQIPHVHIHLVPLHNPGELNFASRSSPSSEELEVVGQKIRAELQRLKN
jgi:histidine triad (HIT) family protein